MNKKDFMERLAGTDYFWQQVDQIKKEANDWPIGHYKVRFILRYDSTHAKEQLHNLNPYNPESTKNLVESFDTFSRWCTMEEYFSPLVSWVSMGLLVANNNVLNWKNIA